MKLTNTLTITTFILLMTQMNLSAVQAGEVHHLPKLGKAISYSNKPQASENEGLKAEEPVVKKDLKKRTAAKNDGAVAPLNSPLEKLGKNVVVGTQFDKSAPQGLAPENNFLSNPVIVNSTTPENQKKEQKVGLGEPNQTVAISPSGTVAAENGTAYSGPSDTKSSDEKKSETKSSDEKKSETKSAPKEDFQKYNDDNDVDPSPQKAPSKVAVQYNGGASDDNLDFSSGKDPKATERIISNKLTSVNEIKEKQISPMEGKISPKEEKGESFAEGFAKTKKTESKGNKAIYDSKPIIASRKKEEVINMGLWEDAKKHSDYRQPTAAKEAHTTPTNYHGTEEDHRQANEKTQPSHLSKVNRKKAKEAFVVSASMHHKNLPNTDYVEPTAAKEAHTTPTDYHGHEEDHRPAVEKKHLSHLSKVNRKKAKEAFVVSASMHHKNLPNTDYVEPTAAKEAHTTPTNYHGTEEDHRQANEKTQPSHLSKVNRKAKEDKVVVDTNTFHESQPNKELSQPSKPVEAKTVESNYDGSVPKTEAPKTGEKVENFALFEAQKNGELNKKAPLSVKPAKKDISLKKEEPPKEAKRTETPFPSKSANANLRTSQKTEEKKDNVTINPPESSSKTIYLIAVFSLVGLLFLAVVVFKIK